MKGFWMMSELTSLMNFVKIANKRKNALIIDNVIGDVKRENINNIILRKEKQ